MNIDHFPVVKAIVIKMTNKEIGHCKNCKWKIKGKRSDTDYCSNPKLSKCPKWLKYSEYWKDKYWIIWAD